MVSGPNVPSCERTHPHRRRPARACNLRCVRNFEFTFALPDSTWVGDGELVEGLAPAHDALALDQARGLIAALAGLATARGALAGPLVLDAGDRQPQQLDDGVVAGEVPAGLTSSVDDPACGDSPCLSATLRAVG